MNKLHTISLKNLKKYTIPAEKFYKTSSPTEQHQVEKYKKQFEMVMELRKARKSLNMTQETLAKKARLPRTTITKVESGTRNVTLETLMIIARAMGKRVEIRLR
ncbi:MAG: helix-turn-helix transcriptional regulator [Candidatus Pacebacteria bacterium]|nr:helix-turn-helix transcriptional regulator [Candidatus Paceibacterota bacterium]